MTDDPLRPVDEVLADLLALAGPLGCEEVAPSDALGRVLARDVLTTDDVPGNDASAMDGFAVRAADTRGATSQHPVRLRRVGASFAGATGVLPHVGHGQAVTIATGASVPPGADAVVRVERTMLDGDTVLVHEPVVPGSDVRRRGEDLVAGSTVIRAGTRVGPGQVAAVAGVGVSRVPVTRAPSVALITTGDEVVPAGSARGGHQVFDAVGPALLALLHDAGAGRVDLLGPVGDDPAALRQVLRTTAARCDLLVTVGGVSKGARDHLRAVLAGLGTVAGGHVALRPGKPFRYGSIDRTVVTCLPGNPGAALVAFEVFVRPVIAVLAGADPVGPPPLRATLTVPFTQPPGRVHWVRAHVGATPDGLVARPAASTGSAMLHSLAAANAWMVVGAEVDELDAGTLVDVRPAWGDQGRSDWVRA